jgi:hypothetical protein
LGDKKAWVYTGNEWKFSQFSYKLRELCENFARTLSNFSL